MIYEIIYLHRDMDEEVEDMHERVEGVCEMYDKNGWEIVNVDFQTGALEVWIVMRRKRE